MAILTDGEIVKWVKDHTSENEKLIEFLDSNPGKLNLLNGQNPEVKANYKGPTGIRYPQFSPNLPVPTGVPVRDMAGVYFYYFGFDAKNAIYCRIFAKEIEDNQIPEKNIGGWIKLCRELESTKLPDLADGFIGWNPNTAEWHIPSYLIFFIDSQKWEWIENSVENRTENLSIHFPRNKRSHCKNISFFNSRTERINLDQKELSILVVENHHLSSDDPTRMRVLDDDDDEYKFDLYFKIKLDNQPGNSSNLIMIIDPSSRNTGP